MDILPRAPRTPVVTIAGSHEWLVRSLESIFSSNGFTTVARTGADASWIGAARPDLVILEGRSETGHWRSMLELVRRIDGVTRATPVMVATAEPLSKALRIEALRVGAWDVFGQPLDAESLILKANTFVAAKLEEADARDRSLIDPDTDLYNVRGVLRRIYEEASEAARHKRPLACLVASVEVSAAGVPSPERAKALAHAFRRAGRSSDVFGRLGPSEFIVVAPGTDSPGARVFAERLAGVQVDGDPLQPMPMRTGYAAVSNVTGSGVEPVDLFVRAVAALRAAQSSDQGDRIRSYD